MNKDLEAVARAHCFSPEARDAGEGKTVLEPGCSCKSPDDCYEINGTLRQEMLAQARYGILANPVRQEIIDFLTPLANGSYGYAMPQAVMLLVRMKAQTED